MDRAKVSSDIIFGWQGNNQSIPHARITMKYAIGPVLWAGVAAGALMIASENREYTQTIDPNATPNPYGMQETWAQLPADYNHCWQSASAVLREVGAGPRGPSRRLHFR
jgi:hypothetical protein